MQIQFGRFEVAVGPGLYVCIPYVGSFFLSRSWGLVWSSWREHIERG
jgi:hypothetical protein